MKNLFSIIKTIIVILCLVTLGTSCKEDVNREKELTIAKTLKEVKKLKQDSLDIKIKTLMSKHNIPGVNVAIIKNGEFDHTRNFGVLQNGKDALVNDDTMFSVGSISKVVHAIIIMKLVAKGKLDLDTNVNEYLKDWKVEDNKFTKDNPVTLRKILSHTAGFSVSGFADYWPEEPVPTITQILNGEKPAKNGKVKVIYKVGSKFQYSGGGTTVSQKVVEDVTGLSYTEASKQILFAPLGLKRTTYENPLPLSYKNVAKAHDHNGKPDALPRGYQTMPENAAAGLWTTPKDLAKIMSAVHNSKENNANSFIPPHLVKEMITRENPSEWGLGPKIIPYNNDIIVEHGGSNDSYKAFFCVFWKKGTGYIVFTNGNKGMELVDDVVPVFDSHLNL